ncbi:MAG: hypothetical protein MHM6MM_001073 [Cercozoa sp. M6MM]
MASFDSVTMITTAGSTLDYGSCRKDRRLGVCLGRAQCYVASQDELLLLGVDASEVTPALSDGDTDNCIDIDADVYGTLNLRQQTAVSLLLDQVSNEVRRSLQSADPVVPVSTRNVRVLPILRTQDNALCRLGLLQDRQQLWVAAMLKNSQNNARALQRAIQQSDNQLLTGLLIPIDASILQTMQQRGVVTVPPPATPVATVLATLPQASDTDSDTERAVITLAAVLGVLVLLCFLVTVAVYYLYLRRQTRPSNRRAAPTGTDTNRYTYYASVSTSTERA